MWRIAFDRARSRGRAFYRLAALALLFSPLSSYAISGNEQVQLAGSGRFDELAKQLEADAAAGPLRTLDLHALCFAYSKLKNYTKLLSCLDGLEARARQGDIRTRLFGLDDVTPAIELMRAEALIDLANYDAASEAAKRVLAWYRREQSDDKDLEVNALAALTIASTLNGNRSQAQEYFAALENVDVSWPRYHAYANAKAYAVARAALSLARYERTVQALAENRNFTVQVFLDNLLSGATIKGNSNWVWQELPRGYMLAKAFKELGRRSDAKEGFDRLLRVKEVEANGEIYWLILYDRGRIAEDENDIDMAVDLYARAIDTLEMQRASISTEANKIGFIGNKQEVYERMIGLLMRTGKQARALEYVERSKSRAFIDMLAAKLAQTDFLRPAPDAGTALTAFLQAEAAAKIQSPAAAGGVDDRRRSVVRAAERLRQVAPDVASLVSVDKIPVARIQTLLGPDETLVQYYLRGNDGHIFLLTRTSLRSFSFPAAEIEKDVKQFRVSIEKRDKRFLELSQRLYSQLIAPLAAELKTANLLIVPHGPLHYLSFAALYDGSKFLVDRFGLRSMPSASTLVYMSPRRTESDATMLVLGNPDLGSAKFDLPDAQMEAETLARVFPQSKLLLRKAASETAFIEQGRKYSMIHIASHGEFNPDTPLMSALMLAKDDANDGQLTAGELYSVKLSADLVTLSACETGLGKVASGDDVVGLSRGFLFAGARSIIASLWKVPDEATSYLMERLYAQLARRGKRDALRTAQLETKKRYSAPFFWAGFYLIGSER